MHSAYDSYPPSLSPTPPLTSSSSPSSSSSSLYSSPFLSSEMDSAFSAGSDFSGHYGSLSEELYPPSQPSPSATPPSTSSSSPSAFNPFPSPAPSSSPVYSQTPSSYSPSPQWTSPVLRTLASGEPSDSITTTAHRALVQPAPPQPMTALEVPAGELDDAQFIAALASESVLAAGPRQLAVLRDSKYNPEKVLKKLRTAPTPEEVAQSEANLEMNKPYKCLLPGCSHTSGSQKDRYRHMANKDHAGDCFICTVEACRGKKRTTRRRRTRQTRLTTRCGRAETTSGELSELHFGRSGERRGGGWHVRCGGQEVLFASALDFCDPCPQG